MVPDHVINEIEQCFMQKGGWENCKRIVNAVHTDGIKEGLTAYAWWKDGLQYVGTCGTTLAEALRRI